MKWTVLTLVTALALWLALPGFAATGYTTRTAFDAATVGYIQKVIVNFDAQADGSSAASYGSLGISASGLASDGATSSSLTPVATNSFAPQSSPNSLGVSSADHQFLAGNSDTITFNLSSPVYAFGAYLVGNPSPTGTPAMPFWKMHANAPGGFDALSAADPMSTISSGNDLYFLGIVSTDYPFTQVTLYSDNDPAAVFSFNVDDLVYATLPAEVNVAGAKSIASGDVRVTAVVTRVHSDRFNIQSPTQFKGITVVGTTTAVPGAQVTLTGSAAATPDDERVINLYGIISQASVGNLHPLGMKSTSVGGTTLDGLQTGVTGSNGPNNIGLDVAICGMITGKAGDNTWIIVDDGAGRASGEGYSGVKVVGAINAAGRNVGDFVRVRGSASPWKSGSEHYPLIRVAQPQDILP